MFCYNIPNFTFKLYVSLRTKFAFIYCYSRYFFLKSTATAATPALRSIFSEVLWKLMLEPEFGKFPANIYMFKVNNICSMSTIETLEKGGKWEICSKLTIKTPERRQ